MTARSMWGYEISACAECGRYGNSPCRFCRRKVEQLDFGVQEESQQ